MHYSTYYSENRDNSVTLFQKSIEEGLDFILSHFSTQLQLFPRTISTKTTEGSQIVVYNKEEALARFKAANYLDCKIAAYPKYVEWKGINRQAPSLIFIDLDQRSALDLTLKKTLENIKERLGVNAKPTVILSGHGYHIYQPVEAILLEEIRDFVEFDQPSRGLLQFAEYILSDKKADSCHNSTISLKNCMLRIPGSYNAKSKPYEEVRIVQKWDGFRPSSKPLLFDLYLYLQDLKLKKIQQQQHKQHYPLPGKLCKYWR
jgi:hypothetical protein